MQDKDFDRFIQQAFDNLPEPEYNPADWDMLEDRLHDLNGAQPNAANSSAGSSAGASAGTGLGKLGLVASAMLVTALNVVFLAKPELAKMVLNTNEKVAVVTEMQQSEEQAETAPEIAADNTGTAENIAAEEATEIVQNQEAEVTATLPAIAAENSNVNQTVVKPAAKQQNAQKNIANTGRNKNTATAAWAWPSVAANRANAPANNQSVSGGQPVAFTEPCSPTFKPEIATVLVGNDTVQNNRVTLSTCQTLEARIITKGGPAEMISLTSNIAKVLPGARLVKDAGSNGIMLQWQPSPEMARQEPYHVTLWVADAQCANAAPRAYQLAVQVNPAFTAAFNGVTRINKGQEATLEVKGAPQGSTYQWVTGNKIVAENESGRMVTAPSKTTTYRVLVTAPTGCVFTDSLRVEVTPGNMLTATKVIPNVFTPNNDGLNDYFEIQLPEEGPYSLEVFDRDGKKVFAQKQYDNKWNAPRLPSGTYYYIITTPRENKTYKGWVEIMR